MLLGEENWTERSALLLGIGAAIIFTLSVRPALWLGRMLGLREEEDFKLS